MVVAFNGLAELSSDSTKSVPNGRRISSLASKDFGITFPTDNSVVAKLNIDDKTFAGAKNLICTPGSSQAITEDSSVTITGVFNKEAETAVIGNVTTITIPAKTMKWTIDVVDWPTCFGDYLAVEISIASRGARKNATVAGGHIGHKNGGPKFGNKVDKKNLPKDFKPTTKVDMDGVGFAESPVLATVDGGEPVAIDIEMEQKGGVTSFIYRLPLVYGENKTLARQITYDPTIGFEAPVVDDVASGASSLMSWSSVAAVSVLASLFFAM